MDTRRVYTVEHLELLDETKVTIKPFSIKKNRVAKEMLKPVVDPEIEKDEEGNDVMDESGQPKILNPLSPEEVEAVFIDIVSMALRNQPGCEKYENRDVLEDALDEMTIYEIIKVTTGYDFLEMYQRIQAIMDRVGVENLP